MRKSFKLIDADILKLHKSIESLNIDGFAGVSIDNEIHIEFSSRDLLSKKEEKLLKELMESYVDPIYIEDVRKMREPLLVEADWRFNRALDNNDLDMVNAIKLYRNDLRNLTKKELNSLVWPIKPWEPIQQVLVEEVEQEVVENVSEELISVTKEIIKESVQEPIPVIKEVVQEVIDLVADETIKPITEKVTQKTIKLTEQVVEEVIEVVNEKLEQPKEVKVEEETVNSSEELPTKELEPEVKKEQLQDLKEEVKQEIDEQQQVEEQ